MIYLEAFAKVLPVLLLIGLGAWLRHTHFLSEAAIGGLKQLVVNITLPAALFLAFAGVSLDARHLALAALVFGLCLLALLPGRLRRPLFGVDSAYLPPLLTGFEAGMMGYAIYAAVFGADNIFSFAVIDLGQVLFVFFILVPYVQRLGSGPVALSTTVRNFLRTPVILSILLGIVANRIGLLAAAEAWPLAAAPVDTLRLLAAATTPLITLVIGYEVNLQRTNLAAPLRTLGLRLLYWVPVGLLLNYLVVASLFPGDRLLQAAVMTMFVLPPPFVIPIFMSNSNQEDQVYVVNSLSLATVVTLAAFTLVSVFYAA